MSEFYIAALHSRHAIIRPSIGSVVARSLGPRDPSVPAYIYICADANPGSNLN